MDETNVSILFYDLAKPHLLQKSRKMETLSILTNRAYFEWSSMNNEEKAIH